MLDGLEITQFTYFQQCGGVDLDLVPAELTYGLERLAAFLQGVDSVYDIEWAPGVTLRATCASRTSCSSRSTTSRWPTSPTLWKLFDLHESGGAAAARRRTPKDAATRRASRCWPPTTTC